MMYGGWPTKAALETGIENPLDAAIVAAGESVGLTTAGLTKSDEIPYDFVRRRLTIVVSEAADPGNHQIVTKGAFAEVLDSCTAFECDGARRQWTTLRVQTSIPCSRRRRLPPGLNKDDTNVTIDGKVSGCSQSPLQHRLGNCLY